MELGRFEGDMGFNDFDQTYQWINHVTKRAKERKILTASEQSHLKKIKSQMRVYSEIRREQLDSMERKLNYLLKYYSTYYNG